MLGVFWEEEGIMRAQQLELNYSESVFLYEVFRDAPWSIIDKTRDKSRPHADGIVGSAQANPNDLLSNQLQQLSIQKIVANPTPSLVSPPAKMSNIHNVQSTNPKANQQAKGK
jgi:hypothetical protein